MRMRVEFINLARDEQGGGLGIFVDWEDRHALIFVFFAWALDVEFYKKEKQNESTEGVDFH